MQFVAFRGYWRILCDSSEHFSGIVAIFQFCNTTSRNNATDENGHQRAVEDAEISTKSERPVCNIYLILF